MESSNIRRNREFYNNNLYNEPEQFNPQEITPELKAPEKQIVNSDTDFFDKQDPEDPIEGDSSEPEKKDFNLKATIAHLQGDLVYSIGVFISAVIINIFPNLRFFDSVCTYLFSYVSLELTIPIFTESMQILLEGTPEGK